jgi:dUTPase
MDVAITILHHGKLPLYATPDAVGLECYASEPAIVPMRGGRVQVQLGFVIAIPPGFVGTIMPLDAMAIRDGVFPLPRTIDAGYRAPICALLLNASDWPCEIETGARVCQLVIVPAVRVVLGLVGDQNTSPRGRRCGRP